MNILQAYIIPTFVSVTHGLICLSCESATHPFLCEHTMHCLTGSICSVEKFMNSGDITYKLGCMDTTKCHSKRSSFGSDIETCRECCATDGCNLNGCGKDTVEIKRGPICFDCDGTSDPTKCHRVKVCEADELCLTQESFRWNVKLFKTSCENVHICQALSGRLPIVGRRRRFLGLKQKRSVLCSKCCSTDLCNTHCGNLMDLTTTSLIPGKTTDRKTTSIELTTKVKTTPELTTVVTTTPELTTLVTTTHENTSVATTRSSSKSFAPGYYEYHIMFIETYHPDRDAPQVYIFATNPGTAIIVSIHGNNNQSIVLSKGENTFDLSSSVVTKGGKERKGVYILASLPIMVFGFSRHDGERDGYLAIPSHFLSSFYIVPSFKVFEPSLSSRSVIGIVSTSNTTTQIKIKLNLRNNTKLTFNSTEFRNGDTLSVVLSELETFQISHGFDLSGSIITSSKPVGVVSGNQCNEIISGSNCNTFTEMILPTNQFDNNFIVPAVNGRRIQVVRVSCPLLTQLQIFTLHAKYNVTVQKEEFYEFEYSQMSVIKSDNDVLVMSYPKEFGKFESYMMTIYGVNQYKTTYNIIVPGAVKSNSFVSMTFLSGSPEGFQIDHNVVQANIYFYKTISNITYTTVSFSISVGAHTISHRSNLRFGLWVYGDSKDDSYGFPGGMAYTEYP